MKSGDNGMELEKLNVFIEINGVNQLVGNISVIIPELSEPPVRTLGATIPENESRLFR